MHKITKNIFFPSNLLHVNSCTTSEECKNISHSWWDQIAKLCFAASATPYKDFSKTQWLDPTKMKKQLLGCPKKFRNWFFRRQAIVPNDGSKARRHCKGGRTHSSHHRLPRVQTTIASRASWTPNPLFTLLRRQQRLKEKRRKRWSGLTTNNRHVVTSAQQVRPCREEKGAVCAAVVSPMNFLCVV